MKYHPLAPKGGFSLSRKVALAAKSRNPEKRLGATIMNATILSNVTIF